MVREWYCVVGNGTVREWHDMVREWHGTGTGRDGYDTAWYSTGMIWYGTVRLVWHGIDIIVWSGMVRYGTRRVWLPYGMVQPAGRHSRLACKQMKGVNYCCCCRAVQVPSY